MKKIIVLIVQLFISITCFPQDWTGCQMILAGDGEYADEFGFTVSISGNYAVVGARYDEYDSESRGSAYVFHKNVNTWEEVIKLTPSNDDTTDYFGYSVCISGDYIIVGAPGDENNGYWSGAAYIFYNNSGNWEQSAKLLPSDGSTKDWFGGSVCISGNYAIIGAHDQNNGPGSAYIFHNNEGNWQQVKKLAAPDGSNEDKFGYSVSIDGDYALIGANYDQDNGNYSGSAYLFKNNSGTWNFDSKLLADDGSFRDQFGRSVSISNNYAIIGAPGDSIFGEWSGSAYIFYNNTGNWEQKQKLIPINGHIRDEFGNAVCISNDNVVIGAVYNEDDELYSGAAYVYHKESGNWTEYAKLTPPDTTVNEIFGHSVGISGNYIIVGERFGSENGSMSGTAYIFGPSGLKAKSAQENNVNYYPNPTNGKFIINFDNVTKSDKVRIQISDITGKTLIEKRFINKKEEMLHTFNLSDFGNGIYIINIITDKEILSSKIVKQ